MTLHFSDMNRCVDAVLAAAGENLVLGTPLGTGKPNTLLNAVYDRIKADPTRSLHLLTALSLNVPSTAPGLETAFMQPILQRLFAGYPDLHYVRDQQRGQLPANVTVSEFFLKSGDYLGNPRAQQDYLATHYTLVARDMMAQGLNVVVQAVAMREQDGQRQYSLSSNPDVTLDLLPLIAASGRRVLKVLVVNRELPFMTNDALIDAAAADVILDAPEGSHALFGAPNTPVSLSEHAIGLHAASLVRDGGTLQIGIGALGDAICHALRLRDGNNARYRDVMAALGSTRPDTALEDFQDGLYGCSEMLVNGLLRLQQDGLIRRRVYPHAGLQTLLNDKVIGEEVSLATLDALRAHGHLRGHADAGDVAWLQRVGILRDSVRWHDDTLVIGEHTVPACWDDARTRDVLAADGLGTRLRGGHALTGGFFLGPRDFYQALRDLDDQDRDAINMTAIGFINQLYGQEALARAQRQRASFINTCMMMTLLGAAVSDGLADGRVVSGVGGQYNFVAMAHALPDAQSVLMLRAVRESGGKTVSNIVWNYGHTTIPRQLRDVVITEYGIAELRGRTDSEVIQRLLAITDSRFQAELQAQAVAAGKLSADYVIPEAQRHNLPERLAERLQPFRADGLLPAFPFGSDLSADELAMAATLQRMKPLLNDRKALLTRLWQHRHVQAPAAELERLGLDRPTSLKDVLSARLYAACRG